MSLEKPKSPTPIGCKQTSFQSDVPRSPSQNNPLPFAQDKSQPAGNSDPHLPQPHLPPHDHSATSNIIENLPEIKPVVPILVGKLTPDASEDPKSPEAHEAPHSSNEEPTRRQDVVSSEKHTPVPHKEPKPPSSHLPQPHPPPNDQPATSKIIENLPEIKLVVPSLVGKPASDASEDPHEASHLSNEEPTRKPDVVSSETHTPVPPKELKPPSSHSPHTQTIPYSSNNKGHTDMPSDDKHGVSKVMEQLHGMRPLGSISLNKPVSDPLKVPKSTETHRAPYSSHKEPTNKQNVVSSRRHTEPTVGNVIEQLHGMRPVGSISLNKPVSDPLKVPKSTETHRAPYSSHEESTNRQNVVSRRRNAESTVGNVMEQLHGIKLDASHPLEDPKSPKSHLLKTHRTQYRSYEVPTRRQNVVSSDKYTPTSKPRTQMTNYPSYNEGRTYLNDKAAYLPQGGNLVPYPLEEGSNPPNSVLPHTRTTPCPSYNEGLISDTHSTEETILSHLRPVPYLPSFPKSKRSRSSNKPPAYSFQDTIKPDSPTVGMPPPYRSYESFKPLNSPYPSSSSSTPYTLATAPYPRDTSNFSGFEPSYSSRSYQVPYPLDEPKHPHPIINRSQPPYPTNSEVTPYSNQRPNTSSSSSRNVVPYPAAVAPRCDLIGFVIPTSTTSESLTEALPFVPKPPVASAPYTPSHAPSAPFITLDHDLAEFRPATTSLGGGSEITPPPSYEEAMSFPFPRPPRTK